MSATPGPLDYFLCARATEVTPWARTEPEGTTAACSFLEVNEAWASLSCHTSHQDQEEDLVKREEKGDARQVRGKRHQDTVS